jgi:hypothetical protein
MRITSALLFLALIGGCDSTVAVGNGNPIGTVGGVVIDATTEQPIMGATAVVISGGKSYTSQQPSDMNGIFSVPKVPAGAIIVQISNMGFITAEFNTTLGGNIGNFPVRDPVLTIGPIGLIPATGTFNVRLVDENGAAVPMVKVVGTSSVRYVDFGTFQAGAGVPQGNVIFNATSDANGLVSFSGIPPYASLGSYVDDSFRVTVPPVKVMGSESYQFLGITQTFRPAHLDSSSQSPTITLAGPHTALFVLESNISYLRYGAVFDTFDGLTVPPGGPITVEFNQAVNPQSVRAVFYDEDGVSPAPSQPTITVTTNLLTITPQAPLPAGNRFNMDLHATSALAALQTDVQAEVNIQFVPFFTAPPANSSPQISGTPSKTTDGANNVIVTFQLSEPIGLGQGRTGAISCVAFYENINLDNGAPTAYPGEYNNNGQSLTCWAQGSPLPAMDITAIRPVEVAPVTTGFTTRYQVTVDNITAGFQGPCSAAGITCSRPAAGTKVHLVFDKLPPSQTVRRTNGQVVATDATHLVFNIPP